MGVPCARIDGNTSSKERERLISLFSRGRRNGGGGGDGEDKDDEDDDEEGDEDEEDVDGDEESDEAESDDDDGDDNSEEEKKPPAKTSKRTVYSTPSGAEGRAGVSEASPPVFLLSTRAGGVGINLQVTND